MPGRTSWLRAAASSLVLGMGGCGTDPDKPPMGRVHGRVTYNGKPLPTGSVMFTPEAGEGAETGQIATGKLDADGSYTLTTFEEGDGAVLGQHVVTVEAREGNVAGMNAPVSSGLAPRPKERRGAMGKVAYIAPKPLIPRKYMDPSTTPFHHTVNPGDNTINLELND